MERPKNVAGGRSTCISEMFMLMAHITALECQKIETYNNF